MTVTYKKYMSKIIYANMGVKSFVKTSEIHFDILNLRNKEW